MILPNIEGLPIYNSIGFGYDIGSVGTNDNYRPPLQQLQAADQIVPTFVCPSDNCHGVAFKRCGPFPVLLTSIARRPILHGCHRLELARSGTNWTRSTVRRALHGNRHRQSRPWAAMPSAATAWTMATGSFAATHPRVRGRRAATVRPPRGRHGHPRRGRATPLPSARRYRSSAPGRSGTGSTGRWPPAAPLELQAGNARFQQLRCQSELPDSASDS